MMLSSTFPTTDSRETGWWLAASDLLLFLCTGTTWLVFQILDHFLSQDGFK